MANGVLTRIATFLGRTVARVQSFLGRHKGKILLGGISVVGYYAYRRVPTTPRVPKRGFDAERAVEVPIVN